jgi:iron complex outermembrane receptor protein
MIRTARACLLVGVCALALITTPAAAQETAQDGTTNATEPDSNIIIVTANKREENLQNVPVPVTVFSQADLDKLGYANVGNAQESTPNLNFTAASADGNNVRVTLRGVGTETLVGGGDPGVALHIDGVYVGRNSAAAADIFDVERLEVLRGPQGTLFGRNANGGSVNIITKRPQDQFEGFVDVSYGNYNALRIRGAVNVPLSDNLSARLTMYSDSHDGYINNLYQEGRDPDDKNAKGARRQLLWQSASGTDKLLRAYINKYGGVGPGSKYRGNDITTANGYPGGYLIGVSGGPAPPFGVPIVANVYSNARTATGAAVLPRPTGFRDVRKNANEYLDQTIKGVDLEASFSLSDSILLKWLSSYQTNKGDILIDTDNSELPIETRRRRSDAKQFSQEFNLLSQGSSPFQWLLGAYYYTETAAEIFNIVTPARLLPVAFPLPPGSAPGGGGVGQMRYATAKVDSTALFAQLSYRLTDRFTITGGIRHTWDKKTNSREAGGGFIDLTNNVGFFAAPGVFGGLPADSGSDKFSEFTYRVTADYKITDDNMIFASYARGYKSGGFDFNGGQIVGGAEQISYNPEYIDSFEVGSKNQFFDNKLVLNLTAFHYDYKDLQVFRLTGFGPLTDNAAQSTIQGIEAEMKVRPTENFSIDGSMGYLKAKYDNYTIAIPPTDFSGNRLNYAPEWTLHLGAEYTVPVGEKSLTARVDWSHRSKTFYDRANTVLDTQKAFSLVNARLRYDADAWFVDLFGRNIFNTEYVTGQLINPPFSCGCRTINIGAPATYGITLGAKF